MNEQKNLTEVVLKPKDDCIFKIPIKTDKKFNIDQFDNLSTTLTYLDKTYSSSIWKYNESSLNFSQKPKFITTDFKTALLSLVETLYGKSFPNNPKLEEFSHLLDLKNIYYDKEKFNFDFDLSNLYNLHDILLYSPRAIDSFEKILFIFYQLLKFYKYINSLNLNCNELKLSDIYIDQNYWVRLKIPFESILNTYKSSSKIEPTPKARPVETYYLKQDLNSVYDSYKHLNHNDLANITKSWCNNKISNFDYLLILNCIAGRKINCPYNHPIFPWISDFQSVNSNLRDLEMSKFRLNKGDPHLDLIYQASFSNPTGPYHLTEFLSEITYFVYKSRITDKETLCKHVRRTWVPNEYPVSINRLYLWTPEECIPEFFCDSSIFSSIHDDLPDLKVPDWCNGSPDEFVRMHRQLLESDLVSQKLNNWIDLVFGFKLTGEAAVEAKNVCLPLIDNHQNMKPYGIVQLFTVVHPFKLIDKTYHSEKAPLIKNRQRNKIDFNDDTITKTRVQSVSSLDSESYRKKTGSKVELNEINSSLIYLPENYNPLETLEQMDILLKFVSKSFHCLPDIVLPEKSNESTFEDLAAKDLKCLACILTEIVLFNKLKCLPQQNTIENRYSFVCKAITQEPHIISGPFMPFILSVLKPFGDLNIEKQVLLASNKKSKSGLNYFLENILKFQTDHVNLDTLLNPHLTILPFKSYFENLYKFFQISFKLDYLITEFDSLKQTFLFQQLNILIAQTGFLNLNINSNFPTVRSDDDTNSKNSKENVNFYISEDNRTVKSRFSEENHVETDGQIKIDLIFEQKFYLALLYLPKLMFDMSDPKKNHLAQSICAVNDSFELIIQYLVNLFENPHTCVNSFLFLFSKLSKFLSIQELTKKILPIILHVLNVVDLSETLGIDLAKDDEKIKFCKLFDYGFMNELRIIFGLQTFLTQICPFLIEAISGFKDFEYETESVLVKKENTNEESVNKNSKKKGGLSRMQAVDQMSPIFDMESGNQIELNKLEEIDELNSEEENLSSKSFNNSIEMQQKGDLLESTESTSVFECDRASLNSANENNFVVKQQENISKTAFSTFNRIIPILGPVLTCKYCCTDLFKMLAICYMNSKCLSVIETSENPLNSIRPIEGDRFAHLILESLKSVAILYGEQIIVLQYLPHVSNTVAACVSRLSMRLEASLLAGIVLVNFCIGYLDIKLLMDELQYILNQILIPVINIYSNEKIKLPNGHLMRQVLAYKTLDILLLISLRLGPVQTRIEMEKVLKTFFSGFSSVRSTIMNPTKPLKFERLNSQEASNPQTKTSLSRGAFKARASIVSFNQQRLNNTISTSKENLLLANNSGFLDKETLSDEMNSFDEYLKFSYDHTTNEIVGSSLKTNSLGVNNNNKRLSLSGSAGAYKYRTQSFGLLSLNNEDNESSNSSETTQNSPRDSSQLNSPIESSLANLGANEEMLNTFTIELAHTAYLSISRLSSGNYIDSILSNGDLIHRMCILDEQAIRKNNLFIKSQSNQKKSKEEPYSKSISAININSNKFEKYSKYGMQSSSYGSSFNENVSIIGNQIQIKYDDFNENKTDTFSNITSDLPFLNNKFTLKFSEKELKDAKSNIDASRHLSENWLAYWENEIRINNKENLFDFKHINLLTLSGHSSSVKCLHTLDNESSIISGSKDKTVKLWSLKIYGGNKKNQQTCQWTYSQHKKPVFGLLFIDSLRVCASCDGSVHVWNPFVGKKLFQFDNHLVTCMSNLSSPSASFAVATADNCVKLVDLRTKSYAYDLKACYAPSGSIKNISASDNLLLVGFSTGLMCLIDLRTGWIQESCKNLDSEILQLKFYTNERFVCSYTDGSVALSSIKDKIQVQNIIKVYNEPVPFLNVNENQLITATNSNKIGIHSNIDRPNQMSFSLNKLQPEKFKGVISCQNYLPLNRLLLVGSDNGDIKLIC